MSIARLSGKVYYDKSFSIGFVPSQKKRKEDKQYDREYSDQFDSYEKIELQADYTRGRSEVCFFDRGSFERKFIKSSESSQATSLPKTRYGKNGITLYGRRVVKNSALILQDKFTNKKLGFGTATLPSLSDGNMALLQDNWGEVVRRFFQEIRRHHERQGYPLHYVGVTEIQENRLANTDVLALHLHWVYNAKTKSGDWITSATQFRRLWYRVICSVLKKLGSQDIPCYSVFGASINCTGIRKSCAAYLGKYMSKGSKTLKDLPDKFLSQLPRQWWFASMQLKEAFKKSIVRMDAQTCADIFYRIEDYLAEKLVSFARYIEICIKVPTEKYCKIGLIGTLSDFAYKCITEEKMENKDIWHGLEI